MVCPYCNDKMQSGVIRSGRDNAVFIPENSKKTFGIFYDCIKLTSPIENDLEIGYCEKCQKIIINLNN